MRNLLKNFFAASDWKSLSIGVEKFFFTCFGNVCGWSSTNLPTLQLFISPASPIVISSRGNFFNATSIKLTSFSVRKCSP